jgi:hypothetical protein
MKRVTFSAALIASLATVGLSAHAAVVVVDDFTGAKSKQVRDAVAGALKKADHDVVKDKAARVPASSEPDAYVKHATDYKVAAFVDGSVKSKKAHFTVTLTVHNGADGAVLGETTLDGPSLPKLLKKIDNEAATQLAASIDQGSVPSAEPKKEPAPEETPKAEAKDEQEPAEEPRDEPPPPPPEERGRKPVVFEVAGGMQVFSRSFEYNQDVNGVLRPYHQSPWPALEANIGYYPGAHVTRNMAANIGLVAGIARSIGASAALDGSSKDYGTTLQELHIGARFRLPVALHEFGVSFVYGNQQFQIDSDHDPNPTAANGLPVTRDYVPDASYQYLRPGLDARLTFGRFRVGAGLGYRIVLGLGELTAPQWFPHATAQALDGFITAGYEVLPGLYAMAGFDATRYALDMHTVPADRTAPRDIAGGAIDQYLTMHFGVEYRLGGSSAISPEARVSERARRRDTD